MKPFALWNRDALKTVLAYLALGFLWIFFSDLVFERIFTEFDSLGDFQTYKGWFFILATGAFLFFLIRKKIKAIVTAESKIREQDSTLEESRQVYSRLFHSMAQGAGVLLLLVVFGVDDYFEETD